MNSKTLIRQYFSTWKMIARRYDHALRDMIILGVILVFHTLLSVGVPYIMKEIVDLSKAGSTQLQLTELWSWANLYTLAAAFLLGWLMMHLLNHAQGVLSAVVQIKLETSVLYQSLGKYFDLKFSEQKKIETGVISSDLWRGSEAFATITYTVLFVLLPILFQIFSIVFILTRSIDLVYAFIFLVFAVLTFAINIFVAFRSQDVFTQYYDAQNQTNQFLIEKIQHHADVKANAATVHEMHQFDSKVTHFQTALIRTNVKLALYMVLQVLFVGLFLLVFMLMTVHLFRDQQVTTGDFVLISSYIVSLTMPLLLVSQSVIRLKGNFIALDKLHAYFVLPKEEIQNLRIMDSEILYEFKNAEFYLGKNKIQHFNYQIKKGKCYVAMGQTGIGKTSFLNYLIGLEQIEKGQLLYKNIDISQQFSSTIFNEIAVVGQMPIVYSGSLRDNLIYNSPYRYSDTELEQWLAKFNLLGILEKNQLGLNDDLQHIYKSFSGGEKQRISMIRALLKQPKLLIMDEPTAALDEQTGLYLMPFIRSKVDSIFMISHAQYAKQFADEILDFGQLLTEQRLSDQGQPL
jgi:ATP-binding cassette subfamily B protein